MNKEQQAKEYADNNYPGVYRGVQLHAFYAGHASRDEEVDRLNKMWNCDKAALKELAGKLEYYEKSYDAEKLKVKELVEALKELLECDYTSGTHLSCAIIKGHKAIAKYFYDKPTT